MYKFKLQVYILLSLSVVFLLGICSCSLLPMFEESGLKNKAYIFPPVIETELGKVVQYSGETKTATIGLTGKLEVKDEIRIEGKKTATQIVKEIQAGGASVESAEAGQSVDITVNDEVRKGDKVSTIKEGRPVDYDEADWEKIVFDLDERPALILIEKEGIAVTAQAWRKYDLDRKFNRGNMTSPFYSEEAWHQGEKVDVYYITITNKGKTHVEFKLSDFLVVDNRGDEYPPLDHEEMAKRLLYKKGRDIMINNGLEKAKEILLEKNAPEGKIKPGQKVEGYLPFYQLKTRPTALKLILPLDKAPDLKKNPTARYRTIEFVVPFIHSPSARTAQPATRRF